MQIHRTLPDAPFLRACALTVGTFDGVHRGHQLLVETLKQEAQQAGVPSAVLTFQDMPYCFFRPDYCPLLLTLPEEKIEAFRALKIDHLFIVPFDKTIADQSAAKFVGATFVKKLGVQQLVIGPDFALGRDRAGDVPALRALGEQHGFGTLVLDAKLRHGDKPISSTRVRQAVESGAVAAAAVMLGHRFSLEGQVVSGRQLGRTIGFPTINLEPHARKVVPAHGVYAVRTWFDDEAVSRPAALNIGVRPTVSGLSRSIEFHVIGQEISTPPQRARLEFLARLRDEQKFANVDELAAQLRRDVEQAGQVLEKV